MTNHDEDEEFDGNSEAILAACEAELKARELRMSRDFDGPGTRMTTP